MTPARRLAALCSALCLFGVCDAGARAESVADSAAQSPDRLPTPARQRVLQRVIRQDCGACHGMRLSGGLGPPITAESLAAQSQEAVFATIHYGRPGTPMPAWKSLLSELESRWIAGQLKQGLPRHAESSP